MARSASVDPLRLDNIRCGLDSIIVKYDDSKADKAGERSSEKNVFSNPFKCSMDWWCGFGVWVAIRGEEAWVDNPNMFLNVGVNNGAMRPGGCCPDLWCTTA